MDMNQIQKYLFYAFVVLLPLQTVYLLREVFIGGEKWQYGTMGIYVSDILLVLVLVLAVWNRLKDSSEKYHVSCITYHVWPALFLSWVGLSILWAPDQLLAGYFFMKLLSAAGVFFLARSLGEKEYRIVILLLIIGAALQSALGAWQFFAQSTFASTWLGMSAHEVWQAGTSVLKLEEGRWLRAYGTLPHPNMLGGFLAAVFMLGIGYVVLFGKSAIRTVLMSRDALRKSGISLRDRFMDTVRMVGIVGIGVLMLLGLILTFSRAAWVGAAIGMALYGVSGIRYQVWRKSIFWTLGVSAAAGIILVGVLYEMVLPRFDGAAIEREGSVSERIQSLRDAERVIGEGNILLGTGVGNFTAAVMAMEPDRPVWSVQPAHNVFVLIFSELGLVGLLFFIGLLAVALLPLLKSSIINPQSAALAAFLPSFFLDHWLWTSHFGLLFFFLIAGLATRK